MMVVLANSCPKKVRNEGIIKLNLAEMTRNRPVPWWHPRAMQKRHGAAYNGAFLRRRAVGRAVRLPPCRDHGKMARHDARFRSLRMPQLDSGVSWV